MDDTKSILKNSTVQLVITIVGFLFQLLLFRKLNQNLDFSTLGIYALVGTILQISAVFIANPLSIIWHREENYKIQIKIASFAIKISLVYEV